MPASRRWPAATPLGLDRAAARCSSTATTCAGSAPTPTCRPALTRRRRARPRRRAGHARPDRLPHPPGLRRPARARVRAAPARRQLRRHRARRRRHPLHRRRHTRRQRRRRCSTPARRAPLRADGRRRDHASRSSPATACRCEHEARCLRVARRLGARAAADGAHHLPGARTPCRRSSTAAPTTTSTQCCAWLPRCTPKGWSTRSTRSASASPSRRRRPARVRGRARARPAGQAACRAAQRQRRRGAGRASSARCRCDHLEYLSDAGVRGDGAGRHASRCCCRARSISCARRSCRRSARCAKPACRWRVATDHNPGLLADALAAADAEHGLHLVPAHARRGAARRDACMPRAPWACATAARWRPGSAPTSWSGTSSIRTSWPTGSAATRCRRVVAWRQGTRRRHERRRLHLHRGTRAAAGEHAARRHRDSRATCSARYVDARARSGGHRLAPRPAVRLRRASWAPACCVPRYSRYVIDLNRPPENTPMYPGANNTELCPTRFFTGEPLYRDGARARRRRDRARAASAYWQPYHDALDGRARAHAGRARPRRAVGRPQHQVASCRGCSKAGCPT